MVFIKFCRGFLFVFGVNCWLVENVMVVGDVIIGDDCFIWFNVVICGDVNLIWLGNWVNI